MIAYSRTEETKQSMPVSNVMATVSHDRGTDDVTKKILNFSTRNGMKYRK